MAASTLAEPPTVASKTSWLQLRLGALLFILYASPGAWQPLFSSYLDHLGFTPVEIGWCCATAAFGCLGAPFLGQVADRWLAAERCVVLCGVTAGVLLWLVPGTTDPLTVFWLMLGAWGVLVPAITLSASLSFTQLPNPARDYGLVRLCGTVGWMLPGVVFWLWFASGRRDLADIFRLGSVMAFLVAAYALTLPHTPPTRRPTSAAFAPLAALRLLRDRSFAVYWLASLGLYVTIAFSAQVTPLLLGHLGIPLDWRSLTLTLSQILEIGTLTLLPMLLLRFGLRGTMLLGLGAWVLALAILTAGQPTWLVVMSLACYGVCVTCFLVAGQLFVNSRAAGDARASAQGLLTFGNGIGQLIGHLLVGVVRQVFDREFLPTFATALGIGGVLLVMFAAGFRERQRAAV